MSLTSLNTESVSGDTNQIARRVTEVMNPPSAFEGLICIYENFI